MAIPWGQIISAAAQVAGSAAASRAKGRADETALNTNRDSVATDQYRAAQDAQFRNAGLDLERQKFVEDSRGSRAKQATIGSLLANLQDVNISVPGITTAQVSGGLRPSALGAGGRAAGELLNLQALLKMLQGDSFVDAEMLKAPSLSTLPKAGKMDSILGALGTYGSMAGGIMGALNRERGTYSALPSGPTHRNGMDGLEEYFR